MATKNEKEKKPSLKELCDAAEALAKRGVSNKEQLLEALPALIALQQAASWNARTVKASRDAINALTEACSEYARQHTDYVFGQTFSSSAIGVESGDVETDGATYHFAHGFDGYCRAEQGKLLTQPFLKALPEGWTKSSLSIDTTAVNEQRLDDETLAEHGLARKVKETWSLVEA